MEPVKPEETSGFTEDIFLRATFGNRTTVSLSRGSNVLGRKTISEQSVAMSSNQKKLNVSRKQADVVVSDSGTITLERLGLNKMLICRSNGDKIFVELSQQYPLHVGDSFTLCGKHFSMAVEGSKSDRTADRENGDTNGVKRKREEASAPLSKRTGLAWIGQRVKIFWDPDNEYFAGTVAAFREEDRNYKVIYDDGETSWELEQDLIPLERRTEPLRKRSKGRNGIDRDEQPSRRSSRDKKQVISYAELEAQDSGTDEDDYVDYRALSAKRGLIATAPDMLAEKKTGVLHHPMCLKHVVPVWHFEKPDRINSILEGIDELKAQYPTHNLDIRCDFDKIAKDVILKIHDQHYLTKMETSVPESDLPEHVTQYTQENRERPEHDRDTFMSSLSMEAAYMAASSVCRAVDLVVSGECRNVFCAVRPPGHHCGRAGHTAGVMSQGYCILNNIAIGAMHLRNNHRFKRIAVIDFDVHHGNGTEDILVGKSDFLFCSIHVGSIYPHTGDNDRKRASNVVNISLKSKSGSDIFQREIDNKLLPALHDFKPDFVLISAGFDGHRRDPTDEGLQLVELDFFDVTEKLKEIANKYAGGRIVSVLEGGYNLFYLKRSVKEHLISLMRK
eukprot:TRINITY_DN10751_c0_g1_i1.p1 TRINITY_DN10751_c0_g1~~TRINITY_DN10751_c0_g1_i1.p1  ORF type:complete len:617 (+),score=121.53 TRINITY_DN10751_c0_g1_i1:108-1958(+)